MALTFFDEPEIDRNTGLPSLGTGQPPPMPAFTGGGPSPPPAASPAASPYMQPAPQQLPATVQASSPSVQQGSLVFFDEPEQAKAQAAAKPSIVSMEGIKKGVGVIGKALARTLLPSEGIEVDDVDITLAGNVRDATNIGNKMALVRKQFPKAELRQNADGDMGFIVGEDHTPKSGFGKGSKIGKDEFIFFDKPNITTGDLGDPGRFLKENALTMAASSGAAGLGLGKGLLRKAGGTLASMTGVGVAGGVDEALKGGLNTDRIITAASHAALGEGAGRLIIGTLALKDVLKRTFGRSAKNFVDENGIVTKEGMALLKEEGLTEKDITDLVSGEINRRVNSVTKGKAGRSKEEFGERGGVTFGERVEMAVKEAKHEFRELNTLAKRKQVAEKGGLTGESGLTGGQATGKFQDQRDELMAANTVGGEDIGMRFASQDKALREGGEKLVARSGGQSDKLIAGTSVAESARGIKETIGVEVSRLYEVAKKANNGQSLQPLELVKELRANITKRNSVPQINDVFAQLQAQKILTPKGKVRKVSVETLEETRQYLNSLIGTNKVNDRVLYKFINSLDDDIERIGGTAFKEARAAAAEKFNEFEPNMKLFRRSGEPKSDIVKKIVSGEIEESKLFDRVVVSGTREELATLKTTLNKSKEGKQAWKNTQASTLQWIWDKSTRGVAPNALQESQFSVAGFKKAIDALEKSGKLKELFDEKTIQKIFNIRDAALLRVAQPGTANTSATGYVLIDKAKKLLSSIPVIGDIIKVHKLFTTQSKALADPTKTITKPMVQKAKGLKSAKRRSLGSPAFSVGEKKRSERE